MLQDGSFAKGSGLRDDVLRDLLFDLSKLRPKLDKRTIKYADSYDDVAKFIKQYRDRKYFTNQLITELRQLANNIGIERKRLLNNEDVREELME